MRTYKKQLSLVKCKLQKKNNVKDLVLNKKRKEKDRAQILIHQSEFIKKNSFERTMVLTLTIFILNKTIRKIINLRL